MAAAVGFAIACWIVDLLARSEAYGSVRDALFVEPFWRVAVDVLRGSLAPYRDFPLEYPPLALPAFLIPGLPPGGLDAAGYLASFELEATLLGVAVVAMVVATIVRLGGSRSDVLLGAGIVAASPLLLGPLMVTRYDLWPALLAGGAVAALLWDRHRLGFALLALSVLAKVYPIVLGPIFVTWAWRRAGRREALIALGVGVVVGIACLAPFVVLDPAGALDPLARSLSRPLQLESLGASILVVLHASFGVDPGRLVYSFGSYNLDGVGPAASASIQAALLGLGLLGLWWLVARDRLDGGRFVTACAAAIVLEVAFDKVLSAQYVMWLIPAVAVVRPTRGAWPLACLAAILVLTGAYYPGMYQAYLVHLDESTGLIILARNLGLIVLAVLLIRSGGLAMASRRSARPVRRAAG